MITLFHKPSLPASVRVQTLLKQATAQASETATEDQATDHSEQNKLQRNDFELNVTEDPPTKEQMRTILEYVGGKKASQLVEGAKDEADALRKLGEDSNKFRRPLVSSVSQHTLMLYVLTFVKTVDWNNGRAGQSTMTKSFHVSL